MEAVRVTGGVQNTLATYHEAFEVTLDKAGAAKIETRVDIPEKLEAPIAEGQRIGTVTYLVNGEEIGASDILAAEAVAKLDFGTLFSRLFTWFLMAEKK
jgi:D-alanyl-D-alanine carboxypeptidase (penicillin-binding protein 5/6)